MFKITKIDGYDDQNYFDVRIYFTYNGRDYVYINAYDWCTDIKGISYYTDELQLLMGERDPEYNSIEIIETEEELIKYAKMLDESGETEIDLDSNRSLKSYLSDCYGKRYDETLVVNSKQADIIKKYTSIEPLCEEESQGDDNIIVNSVRFENGMVMDIKCCGVQYSPDNQTNTSWAEAVLFDQNGHEVAVSDPSNNYFGDWIIKYNYDTYLAIVYDENSTTKI